MANSASVINVQREFDMPDARTRYAAASIALHWLTVLLIVAVYSCIELREFWPKGSPTRDALKTWHYMLGLTVLSLTLVRVAVRLATTTPPVTPEPPRWLHMLANASHAALYVLLLAQPLGGWLIVSAEGHSVPFWGLTLPPLVSENKDLAEIIEEVHETIGNLGYALIGLHAAGALFHHYVIRDNTLKRMMPGPN